MVAAYTRGLISLALALALVACKTEGETAKVTETEHGPPISEPAVTLEQAPEPFPDFEIQEEEVVFHHRALGRGERRKLVDKTVMNLNLRIHVDGREITMAIVERKEKEIIIEVVQVEGGAVREAEVHYNHAFTVKSQAAREKRQEAPVHGKTYRLTHQDGAAEPEIVGGGGQAVQAVEKAWLRSDFRQGGVLRLDGEGLERHIFLPGEEVPLSTTTALALVGSEHEVQVSEVRCQYLGRVRHAGRSMALLDVRFVAVGQEDELSITLRPELRVVVEPESLEVVAKEMRGQVEMKGGKDGTRFVGEGSLLGHFRSQPL